METFIPLMLKTIANKGALLRFEVKFMCIVRAEIRIASTTEASEVGIVSVGDMVRCTTVWIPVGVKQSFWCGNHCLHRCTGSSLRSCLLCLHRLEQGCLYVVLIKPMITVDSKMANSATHLALGPGSLPRIVGLIVRIIVVEWQPASASSSIEVTSKISSKGIRIEVSWIIVELGVLGSDILSLILVCCMSLRHIC
ncbi:uncharacterized protein G2W53_042754 [Senna tora]|uniref:Uncharacterized protein n=1 Tax=Senna tora TaxID=362788 RepID=A0A834VZ84_9FABA|nr:uncharacterized protein G2W53_042754 [Senna tora]